MVKRQVARVAPFEVVPPTVIARRPERVMSLAAVAAPRSRRAATWICLTGVAAVAVFLRLYALDRHGFNSDEAVYGGQAASIAGSRNFLAYFPIYRAHPLLYQAMLSVVYRVVLSDFAARLLSVAFGVGAVLITYALGYRLYGRRAALLGATMLAVMPYHVIVSRQALLDGPQVFFATLALYALARYSETPTRPWMLALSGSLGLTFLTKETSVLLFGSVFTYLALNPDIRVKIGDLIAGGLLFGAMAFVYPLSIAFGGAASTGGSFVVWQLLRRPNHSYGFYASNAGPAIGILVLVAAGLGLVFLRHESVVARDPAPRMDRRAHRVLRALAGEGLPVPAADRAGGGRARRPSARGAVATAPVGAARGGVSCAPASSVWSR